MPLPAFAPAAAGAGHALETGCGIFLFRGFPVEGRSADALRRLYWGIGRHIGTAVSQSKRGDMLGDVRDIGTDVSGREGRGYTSRAELEFHTDSADVSALFFLKTARAGGLSRFVSSVAIHNEIAQTRPDLLEILYRPYIWSRQGQEREGEERGMASRSTASSRAISPAAISAPTSCRPRSITMCRRSRISSTRRSPQ